VYRVLEATLVYAALICTFFYYYYYYYYHPVTCLTVLYYPVVTFFSILRPRRTAEPIFTLYGSNDVFPRKDGPFGFLNDG